MHHRIPHYVKAGNKTLYYFKYRERKYWTKCIFQAPRSLAILCEWSMASHAIHGHWQPCQRGGCSSPTSCRHLLYEATGRAQFTSCGWSSVANRPVDRQDLAPSSSKCFLTLSLLLSNIINIYFISQSGETDTAGICSCGVMAILHKCGHEDRRLWWTWPMLDVGFMCSSD